jgi:hypothetical protein
MMHDNYDPDLERVFGRHDPSELRLRREKPTVDGLYVVYIKNSQRDVGFLYYSNNEWLSYPHKYPVNTMSVNEKLIACIGPVPEKIE